MVVLHFFFEIIKITILSSVYGVIIVFLFSFSGKIMPEGFFSKTSKNKLSLWAISVFFISIFLFIYMFSYWGDHGLGDSARIPIGYGKEVGEIDAAYTYIEPSGYDYGGLNIKIFAKQNHYLIGTTDSSPVDNPAPYFCWDLKNDKLHLFSNEKVFNSFLNNNQLPTQIEFKSFREHYSKYWGGWRLWLLP